MAPGPDAAVLLHYTSGSTGDPKGVVLTYRNLEGSWQNLSATVPVDADDVILCMAPFGHVGGLNAFTLQTLVAGGKIVVQRQCDTAFALAQIQQHHVTRMFGVPALYAEMARQPHFTETDLSSMRVPIVGGAPVPQGLLLTYRDRGIPLWVSWGMTETGGAGTMLRPTDALRHSGSVGRACPENEVGVIHPLTGEELPVGRVGELMVRGSNVTPGYWRGIDIAGLRSDGWLRTGDLAMVDADGYVYLAGRLKDIIISGGENINPMEVEEHLRLHPGVLDVGVVGVADARWGETPIAYVLATDAEHPPTLDQLREFLSPRLARYKIPRQLRVVATLPTSPTGKLDRRGLQRMALDDAGCGNATDGLD